jgi:hypothetical protein
MLPGLQDLFLSNESTMVPYIPNFLFFLLNHLRCETLDDVRLNLSETDYSTCLADASTMTPASLQKSAIEKVRHNLGRRQHVFLHTSDFLN